MGCCTSAAPIWYQPITTGVQHASAYSTEAAALTGGGLERGADSSAGAGSDEEDASASEDEEVDSDSDAEALSADEAPAGEGDDDDADLDRALVDLMAAQVGTQSPHGFQHRLKKGARGPMLKHRLWQECRH